MAQTVGNNPALNRPGQTNANAATAATKGSDNVAPNSSSSVGSGTSTASSDATQSPEASATPSKPKPEAVDTPVNPTRAPPFQIHSNVNITRFLKALVYAEYGVGKTYLAGTAVGVPQMQDVLMVSAEAGELTLYEPDAIYPFHLIDIVHVTDYKTTARVHDFLKLHCSVRDKAAAGDPGAQGDLLKLQNRLMPDAPDPERLRLYRTVIIDSLTEVETYCMASLLGVDYETKLDEDVNTPEWKEYNQQRLMIHRMIRNFRNLPMNIVFTCTRQFKENEQKRRIYAPQMTGKLAGEIQGFMDLCGYLVLGEPPSATEDNPEPRAPRRMYIQPGPRYAAKSRFSRYKKPYIDEPDMPLIMKCIGLYEEAKK